MRRLLVVSRAFPSDFVGAVYGIHQRLRLFLEAAQSVAEHLDILFFVEPSFLVRANEARFAGELTAHWGIGATVRFALRSSQTRSWFKANFGPVWSLRHHYDLYKTCGVEQTHAVENAIEADTDLVIAFQLESALPVLSVRGRIPPMALDLNDITHLAFRRMIARPPRKPHENAYLPALFLGERDAIKRSATAFVCSETARRYLRRVAGSGHIDVAPNAVFFPRVVAHQSDTPPRALLFIGMFAYGPNAEAAEWLVHKIFPLVLNQAPDARLLLVGGYIERLTHLQGTTPNVDFLGFVPDIAEVYRQSAISCSPILAGGGTRTKIIEAAAYRVPVVSTTLGAEGLDFENEREIVLRDDAASFARACVDLLNDPGRAKDIAERAYRRASAYDRDRVIPQIAADLMKAARRGS